MGLGKQARGGRRTGSGGDHQRAGFGDRGERAGDADPVVAVGRSRGQIEPRTAPVQVRERRPHAARARQAVGVQVGGERRGRLRLAVDHLGGALHRLRALAKARNEIAADIGQRAARMRLEIGVYRLALGARSTARASPLRPADASEDLRAGSIRIADRHVAAPPGARGCARWRILHQSPAGPALTDLAENLGFIKSPHFVKLQLRNFTKWGDR